MSSWFNGTPRSFAFRRRRTVALLHSALAFFAYSPFILFFISVGGTEHMCQLFVLRAEENKAQVINPTRPWMNAPRPRELMRGQMEGVGFDNSRPPSAGSHAPSAAPSLPLQNLRATTERRASSAGVTRTYRNHSRVGDHLAWDH